MISSQDALISDSIYEDTDAILFDFDQDKDLDLFVTSGSYEYEHNSIELIDRLYINDSEGIFTRYDSGNTIKSNSMTVTCGDIDGDGDLDLFIGGRVIKGKYPYPPTSYLLVNDKGKFYDRTVDLAADLDKLGMVTDAEFVDMDGDDDLDLVVVGEWLPISFFENNDGKFTKKKLPFDYSTVGWWNTIEIADLNSDNKKDLVIGNLGLNYKFTASEINPLKYTVAILT